jgi:hypothetical protein
LVGEDGMKLAAFWLSIMDDPMRRDSDRLEASRLLADRGWGKPPTYAAIEEADPLDLANLEQAAEEFRAKILQFAPSEPDGALSAPGRRRGRGRGAVLPARDCGPARPGPRQVNGNGSRCTARVAAAQPYKR